MHLESAVACLRKLGRALNDARKRDENVIRFFGFDPESGWLLTKAAQISI